MTDFIPLTLLDEDVARSAAVSLARWSVRDSEVKGFDERALIITENRNRDSEVQKWKYGHSSCGDLPHWIYEMLGVRSRWVNRNGIKGSRHPGYRMAMNLSFIYGRPEFRHGPVKQLLPGDTLYIGVISDPNTNHVQVVLEHDAETKRLTVAQYGGIMKGKEHGIDGRLTVYEGFDGRKVKTKPVVGVLPLWPVIGRAVAAGELDSYALVPSSYKELP